MLECIACSRFYKNKDSLRAHRNRYHPYSRKTSKSNEDVSYTPIMTKSTKIEEDTSSINPDISSTFDETSGNGLEMRMTACNICKKEMRKDVLQQHLSVHKKPCRICKKMKTTTKKLIKHEKKCRRKITNANFDRDFQSSFKCQKAINGRFMIFSIDPNNDELDYGISIKRNFDMVKQTLLELLHHYTAVKFYTKFDILFRKDVEGDTKEFGFNSGMKILLQNSNINELIQECVNKITDAIDNFQHQGSGWIFVEIKHISLHVTEYKPFTVGTFIELPQTLKAKTNSLLNIENNDDKCIIWTIIAALHPCNENYIPSRTTSYEKHFDKINIINVSFPITINDIPQLEKNNSLRINVYGFNQGNDNKFSIFPVYVSDLNYEITIKVLMISDEWKQHFVLITDFDELLSSTNDMNMNCDEQIIEDQNFVWASNSDYDTDNESFEMFG